MAFRGFKLLLDIFSDGVMEVLQEAHTLQTAVLLGRHPFSSVFHIRSRRLRGIEAIAFFEYGRLCMASFNTCNKFQPTGQRWITTVIKVVNEGGSNLPAAYLPFIGSGGYEGQPGWGGLRKDTQLSNRSYGSENGISGRVRQGDHVCDIGLGLVLNCPREGTQSQHSTSGEKWNLSIQSFLLLNANATPGQTGTLVLRVHR
ncbi:hypothetical protein K474DRAFT_1672166 [Panus rudis PR-1116 ss-1]|nr:hypothetical protein K474DRAFT_1672166 [Panus rudis PR-1116 ss-1]